MNLTTFPKRFATILLAGCVLLGAKASAADDVDFNRDVRPILSDHCFACHGPDKAQRKADLRLDDRAAALQAEAFVPGKADESELVARIFSDSPDELMPPRKMNKPLSVKQKDILKRWVAAGAPYAAHWSFTPIVRPQPPKLSDAARNPIDAFIQASLDSKKIKPGPEADRRTLIRRLSLDLIGLPPTPEETRKFVDDKNPDAYDNLVQRLLGSPHYGERMAVPWLDLVRYADTVGFHGDQNQNVWPYRDYVVNAFNGNKPFDQFTIEQLAGDLLPNPTPEQRAATCYNRLNMMTREGGAQAKEYLAKYAADRVRTVGATWLGLTVGCAECHDHKFDPFTARDFYSLSAFFADVTQWGVYADYGYTPNPDLRGYTNDHPFPPEIVVDSPSLQRRIVRLREQIEAVVTSADPKLIGDPKAKEAFEGWRSSSSSFLREHPSGWETPLAAVNNTNAPPRAKGKAAAKQAKAAPKAKGPSPTSAVNDDESVTITAQGLTNDEFRLDPAPGFVASLRVELRPATDSKVLRAGLTGSTVRLQAALIRKGTTKADALAFSDADADRFVPRYQNGHEVIGILGGWKIDEAAASAPLTAVWRLDRPVAVAEGDTIVVSILDNPAARVRVSLSPFAADDLKHPLDSAGLTQALAGVGPSARRVYLRSTAWNVTAFERVKALEARVRECREGKSPVMVTQAKSPAMTRILPRGNWQDETGPEVTPAVPHFLPGATPPGSGARLTRLDLARWIMSPENPLTARVFVNRLWKQFLGVGLSAQVDDLGAQGEWPIHPELLDWLASEFRDGWDVKRIVTLIVTSHTYRQSSNPRPEVFAIDPANRLLASQSPRRLDAEFVRDNALAIAGLIDPEQGGPPSFPYQPEGYYANIQFPDRRYVADLDERQYRRGVYSHWQRTFLHPMLAAFDAPSREDCIASRTSANSPQQALTLLNDPELVESARVLAAHLLAKPDQDAARIASIYDRALCRTPTAEEARSLLATLSRLRAAYQARPDEARLLMKVGVAPAPTTIDPVELASWTGLCRIVLNLHETITRY